MDNLIIQYLLNNKTYFRQVYPYLKRNHFEKIENQEIFSTISKYYNKYKEIPSIREIATELKTLKDSDLKTNIIGTFKTIITSKDEIKEEYLKDKTEEHIRHKEFMDFLISSAESIQSGDIDLGKALNDVQEINKISLQENIGVDYIDIDPRIEYYKTKLKGVKTGLPLLDKVLGGGFRPKTLNIISSKSGGGKSLFGSSLASGMLLNGTNVLVITLEMSDFEYLKRVDANILDLDINQFYALDNNIIKQRFNEIREKIGRLKSVEYPAGRFSALQLENLLDSLHNSEDFRPDIIIIDYLTLMKSDRYSKSNNTNQIFTGVAEEIRAIAQELSIPILTFSQITRGAGNDGASSFDQSQISLAKGIYEAADTFAFIMNNAEMKEEGEIALIIDKNRNTGITGKPLLFDIDYCKMRVSDNQELDQKVDGIKTLETASDMSSDLKLDFGEFNF